MKMPDRNDEPFADDPEGLKEYKRWQAFRKRAYRILREELAKKKKEQEQCD